MPRERNPKGWGEAEAEWTGRPRQRRDGPRAEKRWVEAGGRWWAVAEGRWAKAERRWQEEVEERWAEVEARWAPCIEDVGGGREEMLGGGAGETAGGGGSVMRTIRCVIDAEVERLCNAGCAKAAIGHHNQHQVAVTGQPVVSQPAQSQGTQPQQSVQQPAPQGPQPELMQGPAQSQWVPKTAIAAPKPFTGDKRGEDLNTWLRAVPVYVKCKLTLPHEEVLVAASYLEGTPARWLSGLVQLQGYGHDFHAWAVTQKLDDFVKLVEDRWHDPQEAPKAIDAILTLHTRQFKSVREATDAIECLICVPGVHYDPQVLLTSYLRCFPMPLRNQLAGEANINMHNFPSFSKKALDLEAKIGHGQTPTTNGRRKSLPPNKKAKGRIMFVDNDGSTIELDDNFQEGVGSEAGSVEASGGGVVAAVAQKGKAAGRRHGGSRSRSQVDPNAPPWEKVGLTEDVWSYRYARQACIRCGQYGHNQFKCRNKQVTEKIPPTMWQALGSSAPVDFSGALITEFGLADDVTRSMVEAYREDRFMSKIIRRLKAKDKVTSAEFVLVNGLLFLEKAGNKRLCVPDRESLRSLFLGECHDATRHFGFKTTAANLLQRFWWPTMMRDAKLYVETCQVCQRDKPRTQAPLGVLKPLPIPERPGESLSMDFMDTLVTGKSGMRHIFVIVNRFSKYTRLVAMPETAKTEYVIRLFKENKVRDFGLPKSIVSDKDVRFTSELWKAAAAEQGTQLQMTFGNHPEANGQAEQLNRAVQHLLRHYIKPNQVDWDEKLALIANLYNNAVHNATGVSPNSLLLTFKPRLPLHFLLPDNQSTAAPGTLEFASL
ncbi:hypothetical protein CBR_g49746 [Chara braunii]|uniref:Integrase catalytic domain-containing protein n=1 Tax=Chara braunii TaxID=69332 RepID=A0A388M5S6_CHABU|nr:hypothetical protein CBR_g49746 [Chara braunii]|eukprot:GBG89896.1 hypothetical protein CBR_g49746 [Chara braunii]